MMLLLRVLLLSVMVAALVVRWYWPPTVPQQLVKQQLQSLLETHWGYGPRVLVRSGNRGLLSLAPAEVEQELAQFAEWFSLHSRRDLCSWVVVVQPDAQCSVAQSTPQSILPYGVGATGRCHFMPSEADLALVRRAASASCERHWAVVFTPATMTTAGQLTRLYPEVVGVGPALMR
jgi:hypothetical protein